MAKKTEELANDWDQIEIGDQVKHAKWGVGTVLFRTGMGDNAKAIVVFPEEGQKKLMLKFAGLKKVGSTSLKSVERLKAEVAEQKPTRKRAAAKPTPVFTEEGDEEEVALDLDAVGDIDDDDAVEDEDDVAGFDDDDEFSDRAEKGGTPD